ncbi:MAG: phosphate signaling complex protein PhoU [Halieaceae bacterium]
MEKNAYKQHISEQFNTELDGVKTRMLEMGGVVEQQIAAAVSSLVATESGEAELVVARDDEVNALEVEIEEECSRILARRQPAASDLRLILAINKVITDLERIGDEAAKIARQAINLSEEGVSPSGYVEMRHIGQHVIAMLRNSLDAFARLDVEAAVNVALEDTVVDQEYANAMRSLLTYMMEDPRVIGSVINEMWALRSLERIGDHASNIAEHVIYLVKGLNVRHVEVDEIIARLEEHH